MSCSQATGGKGGRFQAPLRPFFLHQACVENAYVTLFHEFQQTIAPAIFSMLQAVQGMLLGHVIPCDLTISMVTPYRD